MWRKMVTDTLTHSLTDMQHNEPASPRTGLGKNLKYKPRGSIILNLDKIIAGRAEYFLHTCLKACLVLYPRLPVLFILPLCGG